MRATCVVVRMEHEEIHDNLTASGKDVGKRLPAILALEDVLLGHALPRQAALQPAHFVALTRKRFLSFEECAARREPFLVRYHLVIGRQIVIGRHRAVLLVKRGPNSGYGAGETPMTRPKRP